MTKQLNKKGTSLVELIAVIIIMGIIAGIAIPTTIAVINRQKKNAAAKSADAIVSTLKNRCVEEALWSNPQATTGFSLKQTDGTFKMQVSDGPYASTTKTDTKSEEPLGVDNPGIEAGSILVSYEVSSGKYTYTATGFKVNGYYITVANDGTCSASSTAPSSN